MDTIIERIVNDYHLNETDQQVLNYIIQNSDQMIYLSTRDIAKATYTNPMIISRLSKKLGFKGYDDLKYHIGDFIETYHIADITIKENDSLISNVNKATEIEISIINQTKKLLNLSELEQIIHLLDQTKYIDIFANESNSDVAKCYEHYYSSLGKIVGIYDETDRQIYHSKNITKDHIVILLSKQSHNHYLKQSLLNLKNKGINTILITSKNDNIMSQLSTYVIHTVYDISSQLGNFVYHISLRYILDVFYISLLSLELNHNKALEELYFMSYQKSKI